MFGESAISRVIWEPFKNESGGVIPAFAVMHHNGYEERGGNFVMKMEQPSSTFRRLFYINGPMDVPIGGYNSCTRYSAYALCDSGNTPAQDEEWGPKPSSWKLWKGYLGGVVLGAPTGTGEDQRSKIVLRETLIVRCVLDGTLSQGSSATASVYVHDGSSWVDSLWNITAYDDLLPSLGEIAPGGVVWARFYANRWWVFEARCP